VLTPPFLMSGPWDSPMVLKSPRRLWPWKAAGKIQARRTTQGSPPAQFMTNVRS
jgi:hypothetical protein